ncbi:Asp23/Gls24 family envelope stress response protein [Actinomycetospora soli]|uniref:Asp23/Gls24 family envelope stress response protein n=1 Tax=Actinomycetospora soli TaxID=2893887 RepID=UPI001E3E0050|nr:Asp23/Gls24 family envelope stress response protein [Actinomycetospora soli]MCD2187937.1 Asp23/Gls24 family envelope stress response protein [Actinomycetospora soli]
MTRPVRPGDASAPALVAGVDVDRVAAAVLACPLVCGLATGEHGATETYLPGRRVRGVRVHDDGPGPARIVVSVSACYGAPMRRLVEQVRSAVAVRAPGHPVDVVVADVA